jgi:hypothetical protein
MHIEVEQLQALYQARQTSDEVLLQGRLAQIAAAIEREKRQIVTLLKHLLCEVSAEQIELDPADHQSLIALGKNWGRGEGFNNAVHNQLMQSEFLLNDASHGFRLTLRIARHFSSRYWCLWSSNQYEAMLPPSLSEVEHGLSLEALNDARADFFQVLHTAYPHDLLKKLNRLSEDLEPPNKHSDMRLQGMLHSVRKLVTKQNNVMAVGCIGDYEVLFFPTTLSLYQALIANGVYLDIRARSEWLGDTSKQHIYARSLDPLAVALQIPGRVVCMEGGVTVLAPFDEQNLQWGSALTEAELAVRIPDRTLIGCVGDTDGGASDRALAIARRLAAIGLWDTQQHISIENPYDVHAHLFFAPLPNRRLAIFVDPNTKTDALCVRLEAQSHDH